MSEPDLLAELQQSLERPVIRHGPLGTAHGRWVTITPLDTEVREQMSNILGLAADLAREGNTEKALRLKNAHDEIRRLLTESYPDDPKGDDRG